MGLSKSELKKIRVFLCNTKGVIRNIHTNKVTTILDNGLSNKDFFRKPRLDITYSDEKNRFAISLDILLNGYCIYPKSGKPVLLKDFMLAFINNNHKNYNINKDDLEEAKSKSKPKKNSKFNNLTLTKKVYVYINEGDPIDG